MLVEALDAWGAGDLEFDEQPEEGVTYAEKIDAAERRVDPGRPAAEEALRIRALSPAHRRLRRARRRRSARAAVGRGARGWPAGGEPSRELEGRLLLGCSPGALAVGELQPAGGRWMAAADYLRGRGLPAPLPSV